MLETLTPDDFQAHLDETFSVPVEGGTSFPLELAGVEILGGSAAGSTIRKPFSLLFLGPPQPILPQRIYRLDNAALGTLEIFLVPLGPQAGRMRYEAVFT